MDIVSEHIDSLNNSRLLRSLKTLNIGIVGSEENQNAVLDFLTEGKLEFTLVARAANGYEQITLDALRDFSANRPSDFFLYCHTKGSSVCESSFACSETDEARHRLAKKAVSEGLATSCREANSIWRRNMTTHTVFGWEKCVAYLDDGFDSVGSFFNYIRNGEIFYYGNFWWAKGELINTLKHPSTKSRYSAEQWLFSNYKKHQHRFKNLSSKDMFVPHGVD